MQTAQMKLTMNQMKGTQIEMMATDIEIMERLQSRAVTCGKRLTYTHKLFYMRLLNYAAGEKALCPEGLKVSLTVSEMTSVLNITKRMVVQALKNLSDCGILLRYKGEKSFPPNADITIIKKEFYERSNSNDSDGFIQ